jgi:hypothetical protein
MIWVRYRNCLLSMYLEFVVLLNRTAWFGCQLSTTLGKICRRSNHTLYCYEEYTRNKLWISVSFKRNDLLSLFCHLLCGKRGSPLCISKMTLPQRESERSKGYVGFVLRIVWGGKFMRRHYLTMVCTEYLITLCLILTDSLSPTIPSPFKVR